jgi:VWFA-related protein
MLRKIENLIQKLTALAMMGALVCPNVLLAQQAGYTFKAQSELVLVNVSVRDKSGNLVRDLKPEDFTVLEDNKPQKIASFDIENTESVPVIPQTQVALLTTTAKKPSRTATANAAPTPSEQEQAIKDRRLIILFFDLSAMQPDEIERSVNAANGYLDKQMAPSDLVSVVSLANTITVNQDFTSDREVLKKVLQTFGAGAGTGFEEGSTGTTEGTADTGNSFTVDDTEYNIFNTDRRLQALRTVAQQVASVPQKKALIYFSSGMDRTGIENQSELRAATNAAVLANMSIYTMDIRGLQALPTGGAAQNASLRGKSPYSGQSTLNDLNANFTTQETLVTLAADTGGRAYLDSNDFGRVFRGVQDDTAMYYLLGYHSSNTARDGKFRRITVKLNRPGLKMDYRKGYYAEADFIHANKDDRERQLQEELASDLPSTDLPVYLATGYFRVADNKYYVPISLIVPGSEIPFTQAKDQDKATLDVLGLVTDEKKQPAGEIRDTVKLSVNQATGVRSKNVQYGNYVMLPPGKFHLKIVVRENQSGRMGSFETDFVIPDLKSTPLKMSSVVMANQVQPATNKSNAANPLVRNGSEIVPSVTRVFSSGQHLYFYYEVYDPAKAVAAPADAGKGGGKNDAAAKGAVRVLSNVSFFIGDAKAYETPLVEVQDISVPTRRAAVFQLDVPLNDLKPGFYTCQVNVIDDAGGHFLFPRMAMLVRGVQPAASTPAGAAGKPGS